MVRQLNLNLLLSTGLQYCSIYARQGMNRGTSKRTLLNPDGDETVPSVRSANKMVARKGNIMTQLA